MQRLEKPNLTRLYYYDW